MTWRFAFFGSSGFGLPAVEQLIADPRFTLAAVITQPSRPSGRGHKLMATPVADWAVRHQVPLHTWSTLRQQPDVQATLVQLECDFMLVAAYGCIVPAELLGLTRGWINLHASLLPRHRGAAPIAAAIVAGDTETGVSVMQMDAGVDTGPVLQTRTVPILANETAPQLEQKLAQAAADLVAESLADWLNGKLLAQTQPSLGASYASKLQKDAGHCTWDSALGWERKVRAYTPWPGVWAEWNGQRISFVSAEAQLGSPLSPLGTIERLPSGVWGVACQDGWFIPTRLQRAGRQPIPAINAGRDWPGLIGSRLT